MQLYRQTLTLHLFKGFWLFGLCLHHWSWEIKIWSYGQTMCIFRHSSTTKGYILLDLHTQNLFVSRDILLLSTSFLINNQLACLSILLIHCFLVFQAQYKWICWFWWWSRTCNSFYTWSWFIYFTSLDNVSEVLYSPYYNVSPDSVTLPIVSDSSQSLPPSALRRSTRDRHLPSYF